jgi:Phytanoyl-CoA dioxygenase (PhyH)
MISQDELQLKTSVLERTADDKRSGRISEAELRDAQHSFTRDGFLQMNDVLPREFVAVLERSWAQRYATLSDAESPDGCIKVGDRRYMTAVDVSGPFNDPLLYANPYFFPLVSTLLGGQPVIDSFGAVSALPGAAAQHIHADHVPLFLESQLSGLLPCYALTVVLPLVDLDSTTGSTAVWLGSHRDPWPPADRDYSNAHIPHTKRGTVYLMDYRLMHGGTANRSDRPRPLLYLAYARPWFTDSVNFATLPRMKMSSAELSAVPREFQSLFVRVPRHAEPT